MTYPRTPHPTDPRKAERFYVIVGVVLLLAGLTAFTFSNLSKQENNDLAELCILEELEAHRVNTYNADKEAAAAQKRPFNPPQGMPDFRDSLKGSCARFYGE